jgi:exocyst complex component 7
LQGVFLANTVAQAERMIRTSDLQHYLRSGELDSWKRKASQLYGEAWREISTQLLDVTYTKNTRPPSHSQNSSTDIVKNLSSKERESVKEKFSRFNPSFDELVSKHKSYKMDQEVRRLFGRDVQALIEPLYSRFWERYHDIDKGKGKYVKYDKAQMSSILASLS